MQFRHREPIDQKNYALYELGAFCYAISQNTALDTRVKREAAALAKLSRLAISVKPDGTHISDEELQGLIEDYALDRDTNKIGALRRS